MDVMASPAKILTDLPADAVCQVLVALDDAYDIATCRSVCNQFWNAADEAFVLRPHLAKVARLAKQVAQLEIENAELQKHTIIPADQERLFAKLHKLETQLEAQTTRAEVAEARIDELEGELDEQAREEELLEEQLQEEKERADKEAARGWKLALLLQQQNAPAEPGWLRRMLHAQHKRQEAEVHRSRSERPRSIRLVHSERNTLDSARKTLKTLADRQISETESGLRRWPNGRPMPRPLTSRVIRR
jgi:hypothetical protein